MYLSIYVFSISSLTYLEQSQPLHQGLVQPHQMPVSIQQSEQKLEHPLGGKSPQELQQQQQQHVTPQPPQHVASQFRQWQSLNVTQGLPQNVLGDQSNMIGTPSTDDTASTPLANPPSSYNQKTSERMRQDEGLFSFTNNYKKICHSYKCKFSFVFFFIMNRAALEEMATISPVLYANTNHPELKTEYPNWTERCKQILKKWRVLPTEKKAPYLQRARDNRSCLKKAQQVSTNIYKNRTFFNFTFLSRNKNYSYVGILITYYG